MPGLLDFLNTDDGKLGIALLSAAGPSMQPMGLGQRLQGAMQSLDADKQNALKAQLLKSQVDENNSQVATRNAALARQKQLLDMFSGQAPSSAVPAQPGQLGSGSFGVVQPPAGMPSIPQAAPQGQSRIGSMTPDQLVQAKMLGLDLTDVYKLARPDMQVSNGYAYDKNTVKPGFLPGVNIANDGRGTVTLPGANGMPTMSAMPGSVEAYGTFEDRKNQSQARTTPQKVWNPATQREEYRSTSDVLGTPAPTALPPAQSGVNGAFVGDPAKVMEAIQQIKDPQERANALAAFHEQARRTPNFAGAGFAAGPSNSETLSKDATGKLNESFIKSRYEPTIAAGDAANDMLTNVNVARTAMRNMGGTGWGTENKASAASVLSGLGVAPANAKFYAANAETFQNVAMSNLKTQLDAAKGPQTEGDADRTSKTFAQLKNTPQANEFILDLAEAKAARDQMKARFFQQAMPIAQQKGDLQELEREWLKRAPSVFNMPSMQRWGSKK